MCRYRSSTSIKVVIYYNNNFVILSLYVHLTRHIIKIATVDKKSFFFLDSFIEYLIISRIICAEILELIARNKYRQ